MRTTPRKRLNSEVMKSVIEATLALLWLTVTVASAQQRLLSPQHVPSSFNPSPTFDPGASLDSTRLQQRLLNSAGAYLPGLGFKYPSFNQDILR